MKLDLHGDVALVTGGAGAIGAAVGSALHVTDRDAFARVVADVRAQHGSYAAAKSGLVGLSTSLRVATSPPVPARR